MKRTVIGAWMIALVLIIALILIGCLSRPPQVETGKIPPMDAEQIALLETIKATAGEPRIYGVRETRVYLWIHAGTEYRLIAVYDPELGYWITALYKSPALLTRKMTGTL